MPEYIYATHAEISHKSHKNSHGLSEESHSGGASNPRN